MDISPPISSLPLEHAEPSEIVVPLTVTPLSPWLRLAHITTTPKSRVPQTSQYRAILDFELVFQLSGTGWIAFEAQGGSLDIQAGEVAFIPPHISHAWSSQPGRHIAVHFDFHAQPSMIPMDHIRYTGRVATRRPLRHAPHFRLEMKRKTSKRKRKRLATSALIFPAVTRLSQPRLWRERLEPLIQLWNRRAQGTLRGQLLAAETLTWALNTIQEDARQQGVRPGHEIDPAIATLLKQIDQGENFTPSVAQMAQRTGLGLTSFRNAFSQATGRTPRQYVEELRMERAARALAETDFSIQRIAQDEGYEDPYHFSRAFKRVMGHSPRIYRNKIRSGQDVH